ncbi:MAG: Gfo/Idh/MocA family oxidoreductase [Clostridiales bacterium]|nr:Gfo/Idh/MocA family oxidoreductase [Clostridiales bacterium]
MNKVRFGIVGFGNMGSTHAKNLHSGKIIDAELTAVCDIDAEKRKKASELANVAVFEDYRELIRSGIIDAVIIATPHYLHPPIAIEAFGAGLNVLTEKPAGVRVSDVIQMNNAAKKSGRVFGIMWNQRTNPLFQKARELIRNGTLGTPKRLVWIITNWYRTQSYYNSASWRATWAGEGGGVLLNQAPHNLDLWQWIFGMPDEIYATCDVGKWHDIEVEDDAIINGYYKNGATATFITSTGEYPGTNRLEISGSRGKLVIEKKKLNLYLLEGDEREFCYNDPNAFPEYNLQEQVFEQTEKEPAHNGIIQNFTNAVLYGEELLAPGYDGINEIALSNAAYLSSWTGKRVSVKELDTKLFDSLLEEKIKNSKPRNRLFPDAGGQPCRWHTNW